VESSFTVVGASGNFDTVATATVSGTNSKLTLDALNVGAFSTATLNISAGGQVENSGDAIVGDSLDNAGIVNIDGANSLWQNTGFVEFGENGHGALNITGGGRAEIGNVFIGRGATVGLIAGTGTVTVSGVTSQLLAGNLHVGLIGEGTLNITSGGAVINAGTELLIGRDTRGEVNIASGGRLETVSSIVGGFVGPGIVSVTGAGSQWLNSGSLIVSQFSQAAMSITDGGLVQNGVGTVGSAQFAGSNAGAVVVDGLHSRWINQGALNVGSGHDGTLTVTNRGSVSSVGGSIGTTTNTGAGARGIGVVTVDGPGSEWLLTQSLFIGESGTGTLHITDGGLVDGLNATVAANAGSAGAVSVDGPGSLWFNTFEVFVGTAGSGTVSVTNGGTIRASTIRVDPFGILRGNGTIVGNVLNFGIVAPGASIGTMQVNGDFSQRPTGVLEIEIGGTSSSQVDVLNVGAATLDGELRLKLIAGTIPPVNVALTATSLVGQFDNVANGQRLTTVDGLGSFVVNYGAGSPFSPTQIVLSSFLALGVPGDYNNNGTVDAADYVLWRKGGPLANEVNSPGVVNAQDYIEWHALFGSTGSDANLTSSASVVPEPANGSLLLFMLACGLAGGARRAMAGLRRRFDCSHTHFPRRVVNPVKDGVENGGYD
jgi:T5SS/PEP-CTERM-associated repeat protein